eukprot:CAMPEP_0197418126 /NCGR_PEP_ID=MMETSP1170-20131217/3960_1 /TAXON_ID=54406 /ORGANISM="Sarcinochrysis sp, Strain CCMP770" /LENGTH=360 /DNA_ID=CAMNT_0042945149 /DNA_START=172 /DNA_END=1251 /DNA_ORIENTATION=+
MTSEQEPWSEDMQNRINEAILDKQEAFDKHLEEFKHLLLGVHSKQTTFLSPEPEKRCCSVFGTWSEKTIDLANTLALTMDLVPSDWEKLLSKSMPKYIHRGAEAANDFLRKLYQEFGKFSLKLQILMFYKQRFVRTSEEDITLITIQYRISAGILNLCSAQTAAQFQSKLEETSLERGTDLIQLIADREIMDWATGQAKWASFQRAEIKDNQSVATFATYIERHRTTIKSCVKGLEPNTSQMMAKLLNSCAEVERLYPVYQSVLLKMPEWYKLALLNHPNEESASIEVYQNVRLALEYGDNQTRTTQSDFSNKQIALERDARGKRRNPKKKYQRDAPDNVPTCSYCGKQREISRWKHKLN